MRLRAPQRFVLDRIEDETGVSGTGIVAVGVRFPDGKCVTRWCSQGSEIHQTCVWDSIDHVKRVHGHGGKTTVRWLDDPWECIQCASRFVGTVRLDEPLD